MKKRLRLILGFFPCVLVFTCWFIYCYGSSHQDTEIGLLISSISSGYQDNITGFSTLLSLNNHSYIEEVALEEVEDTERIEEEKAQVALMNAKKGIADLNNWVIPVTGNYTITTYYNSSHHGIDYYSYNGYDSDILAANNGTVYSVNMGCSAGYSACNGGRGNYIVINHNNGNYYTMYMHIHNSYVNVGDVVSSKDVIASMGNTGYVIPLPNSYNPYGGTHLHFEVYIGIPDKGGYTINPLSLY